MSTVIETKNLSKKFKIGTSEKMTLFNTFRYKLSGENPTRELWALRDINISVKKGEMLAVLGPNGAGKTTLLRILSGIMSPTSGSYEVKGEVSCIFELGLGFNPKFTALENVYLYAALHGLSRKEINKKLPEIVKFSELDKFMGAKLSEFSSGMRARLAFATVMQTIKGIVMIDELLAVGDSDFQKKCIAVFEKLINEGNTMLFITHAVSDISKLCKNALYIDAGHQMGFGSISEIEEMYRENQKF